MSTDRGYVKVFRDIREHEIWQDKPFSRGQAWIDLIMMVNHEDKKVLFNGHFETVHRGMTITSLRRLADKWGWSVGKVGRFLDELQHEFMIRQERNSKRTAISIVNYDDYQKSRDSKRNTERTLTEHRRNTDGTKQYTNKDTIEGTIKKNPYSPLTTEELEPDDEYLPDDYWEEP